MDLSLTPEQEAFGATVRAWLKTNIPREWKSIGSSELPRAEQYEFLRRWQHTLFDAGFIGLTWPKEYGGGGLTFMEELILQQEMALAKAPPRSYDLIEARVSAGDAALYATPNDEREFARLIAELLDDPERRARLGALGRQRVEQELSWEHSRAALLGAYETLLARGGSLRTARRKTCSGGSGGPVTRDS